MLPAHYTGLIWLLPIKDTSTHTFIYFMLVNVKNSPSPSCSYVHTPCASSRVINISITTVVSPFSFLWRVMGRRPEIRYRPCWTLTQTGLGAKTKSNWTNTEVTFFSFALAQVMMSMSAYQGLSPVLKEQWDKILGDKRQSTSWINKLNQLPGRESWDELRKC